MSKYNLFMYMGNSLRDQLDHILTTGDVGDISEFVRQVDNLREEKHTRLVFMHAESVDFFWTNRGLGHLVQYVLDTIGAEVPPAVYSNCLMLMLEFFRLSGQQLTNDVSIVVISTPEGDRNVRRHPIQAILSRNLQVRYG